MPRKRKNYARRVKRYGRVRRYRKRRGGRPTQSICRLPCVPDRMFTKFKCTDSLNFYRGNVGQLQATWAYRPNTLRNWIGTTNTGSFGSWTTNDQPGMVEFGTLYRQYRVLAFKFDIQFIGGTTLPHIFTVYPTNRLPAGVYYLPDRPRAMTKVSGTASSVPVRFRGYYKVGQLLGDNLVVRSQGGYQAQMGSDPTEFVYIVCQAENASATNQVATEVGMMVRITRYVELFDKFDLES